MKEINKILVPTDFSETASHAFRYALWFADQVDANLQLLHVIYPEAEPLDFSDYGCEIYPKENRKWLKKS